MMGTGPFSFTASYTEREILITVALFVLTIHGHGPSWIRLARTLHGAPEDTIQHILRATIYLLQRQPR